jgi:MFS family permease
MYTFFGLAAFTSVFAVVQKVIGKGQDDSSASPITGKAVPSFRAFQRRYLIVYYIIMLADWLQGTNMYTLYSSYGVNISALFITGFTSSLIFGTVIGLFVDRWGRRFSCIVYLLIEIVVNICEHYNNFPLLLTSRIAGGVSTSLLFSAFESWMVSEHRALGFPEEWLADTFSWASFGNGLSAIAAGLLAQVCQDAFGEIGPFQAAIAFTILALPFVCCWRENYGESGGAQGVDGAELNEGEDKMSASLGAAGMRAIMADRKVLLVGLVNSFFEGSMYSFVFMWVPTMLGVLKGSPLPNGLVFSSFMCCISLGGLVFASLNSTIGVEKGAVLVFVVGACALLVPVFVHTLVATLFSFIIFETCVGTFFPCAGYLRSKVIPNNVQGSVMNIFRVPLNIFVIVGTKLTDIYPTQTCFTIIVVWLICGAILQVLLIGEMAKTEPAKSDKAAKKTK